MTLTVIVMGVASASESQHSPARPSSLPKGGNSKQVQEWLGSVGLDPDSDGLARDVLQVVAGVDYPVNPSVNFVISANGNFSFGLNF